MAGGLDALAELHDGMPVPEYGAHVPWLITEPELYRLIPADVFTVSPGGWPMLGFTLLGVTGVFAFNFVTHHEHKLIEVQLHNDDESSLRESFRDASARLRERLGDPNRMDMPEYNHLLWRDERVWVKNIISTGHPDPPGRAVTSHILSVFAAFGMPRRGVETAAGAHARVRDLFRALPGVRVDWVSSTPKSVRFGLAVSDPNTLSRLVHLACSINLPVHVEVDWACQSDHDDPACVRYDFRVPVGTADEPDDRLELLEKALADEVSRRRPPPGQWPA